MSNEQTVRVGVIGCGAGIFHLNGYSKDPRVKIVALAGLDTDRCERLAKDFEIPRVYTHYQDLLGDSDIDAVSVVVPNHLHLPVSKAAFEAGKHVLVEKPLAGTVADGEQMVALAKEHGKLLGIAFQRRWRHDVQIVRELIENGEMGDVYHAKAFWMRRSGIPGWGSWFTSKEAAGGGPLIDLGVHVLDMALYMLGNPKIVSVSAATYDKIGSQGKGNWPGTPGARTGGSNAYEVEDFSTALLRFKDGSTLALDTAWAAYTEMTDEFGVQVFGSNGGAKIHSKEYADVGTLQLFSDVAGTATDAKPRLQSRNGHEYICRHFVDAVLNGTPVSPSGEEGLDRVRIIEAIYRSAALGREVLIDEVIEPVQDAAD
ncbi:MAG TPA: Gfo/Idh/MocA family oxidoreductase [Thermomicrobiales bacterium]|nr:Gfo/Idh/MocA family oxidoreductase [Thermomicrobiales bacterium]